MQNGLKEAQWIKIEFWNIALESSAFPFCTAYLLSGNTKWAIVMRIHQLKGMWVKFMDLKRLNLNFLFLTEETQYIYIVGLDRTGHMSFLTGQDRTSKFAGQVLPDRTESGLILLNILLHKKNYEKKNLKKKFWKKNFENFFLDFFLDFFPHFFKW